MAVQEGALDLPHFFVVFFCFHPLSLLFQASPPPPLSSDIWLHN